MNSPATILPEGFESLEPFVEQWAIAGSHVRLQRRLDSTDSERKAFYEATRGLVPAALELLDKKPLDQFDDRDNRLMNLVLSMAHVSLAVEVQKEQEPMHAKTARYITITRSPADSGKSANRQ